jgi:hypothetical protein
MKKLIVVILVAMLSTTSISAADKVSEKVLRVFKQAFPDADNPSWFSYDNYYMVYFKSSEECSCRIFYDPEGKILKTQRYYSAAELSPFIKSKVNEKYPGKKITGVTEINSDEELVYHIILQDDKKILYLKSDAKGELNVEEKLNKE